jgi:hypothetical protein
MTNVGSRTKSRIEKLSCSLLRIPYSSCPSNLKVWLFPFWLLHGGVSPVQPVASQTQSR